jgi:hypothetical protein
MPSFVNGVGPFLIVFVPLALAGVAVALFVAHRLKRRNPRR